MKKIPLTGTAYKYLIYHRPINGKVIIQCNYLMN